jgi:hypothetical protein
MFGGNNDWRFAHSPLAQLGSLMLHLHPYDSIWQLGKDASVGGIGSGDEWARGNMVRFVPWIYLGGAFACVFGAWKTLRGLEEPRVRS